MPSKYKPKAATQGRERGSPSTEEKASEKPKKNRQEIKKALQSRAILYLSHLPHGFYEEEIRGYLSQFGVITNLRLGRSARTGGSKGYAFVEFKYPEVAEIVCETLNNYLMFDRLVKCQMVPKERQNRWRIFKDKVEPTNPPGLQNMRKSKEEVNALKTEEQNNKRLKKQLKKLEQLKSKLEKAGIDSKINIQGVKKAT